MNRGFILLSAGNKGAGVVGDTFSDKPISTKLIVSKSHKKIRRFHPTHREIQMSRCSFSSPQKVVAKIVPENFQCYLLDLGAHDIPGASGFMTHEKYPSPLTLLSAGPL